MNPGDRKSLEKMAGITFALDNGCFADKWRSAPWLASLERFRPLQAACLFAVVPDVVAKAGPTRARWAKWAPVVRGLGYRCAYVAQDGLALSEVPWGEVDVWFTGGSDDFKLSEQAYAAQREAKSRGKWTHMGRVNSLRRLRAARDAGYDSADGTFIAFAPDTNLPRARRWFAALHAAPALPYPPSAIGL